MTYTIAKGEEVVSRDTLDEILNVVLKEGMCPSVRIYQNGEFIGEAIEYLQE